MLANVLSCIEAEERWILVAADICQAFDCVRINDALDTHRQLLPTTVYSDLPASDQEGIVELVDVVLHGGDVAYEKYFNDQTPGTQHLMFSVTKSFTGTMMLMLMEQGRIDAESLVAEYLPELKNTAFGDATVQQILDMTNSINYVEDYYQPDAHITGFLNAMLPGGEGLYSNLQTLTEHMLSISPPLTPPEIQTPTVSNWSGTLQIQQLMRESIR